MHRVGPLEITVLVGLLFGLYLLRTVLMGRRQRRQLREQEARQLAMGSGPHVIERERERVIERQVLVVRCRFCSKLTPVDLSACKECGAKL